MIILLGAQTIAELERAERAGVSWWINPDTASKEKIALVEEPPATTNNEE